MFRVPYGARGLGSSNLSWYCPIDQRLYEQAPGSNRAFLSGLSFRSYNFLLSLRSFCLCGLISGVMPKAAMTLDPAHQHKIVGARSSNAPQY